MEANNCYEFDNSFTRVYYDTCKQDDKDKNLITYYLGDQKVLHIWCNNVDVATAIVAADTAICSAIKKYIDV